MSDNLEEKKVSGLKQAWRNPKARKAMLLSAGVLVTVGVLALNMINRPAKQAPQPPGSASVQPPPAGQRDLTVATPESYKQLVKEADKERAEAQKSNPTAVVMPTLSFDADQQKRDDARERGRQAALTQAVQSQPQQIQTSAQAAGVAGPDPRLSARNSEEYRSTQKILQSIFNGASPGPFTVVHAPAAPVGGAPAATTQQGQGGASAPGAPSAAPAPAIPIIQAGEILFATIDTAINSDYSGPVVATVHQGRYAGSRLIGLKTLEQDAVVVRFSNMALPSSGPALSVNAYAVSLGDARQFGQTGLQGSTDYHVFQRYVMPAAMAFAQSFGATAAAKGQTTTTTEGGAMGTTVPGLTNKDRTQIAAAAALQAMTPDVQRQASRPITVSMPAGTEIGIMFATDVMLGKTAAAVQTPTSPQGIPPASIGTGQQIPAFQMPAGGAQAPGYPPSGIYQAQPYQYPGVPQMR